MDDELEALLHTNMWDVRGFSDGDPEEDMDDCGGDFEGWD